MLLPASRAAISQPEERGKSGVAAGARLEPADSTPTSDVRKDEVSPGRIRRLQVFTLASLGVFGYFAWMITRSQEVLQQQTLSQRNSMETLASSVATDAKRIDTLTVSLRDLTAAIRRSVGTLKGFETELGKRDEQLANFSTRLGTIEADTRKRRKVQPDPLPEMHTPPTVGAMLSPSQPASPSNPHVHSFDLSIPHPNNTVVHHRVDGEVDYWLALKITASGAKTERVEPFGTNSDGVKVHSIEDGRDYILTPSGDWIDLSDK